MRGNDWLSTCRGNRASHKSAKGHLLSIVAGSHIHDDLGDVTNLSWDIELGGEKNKKKKKRTKKKKKKKERSIVAPYFMIRQRVRFLTELVSGTMIGLPIIGEFENDLREKFDLKNFSSFSFLHSSLTRVARGQGIKALAGLSIATL